MNLESIKSGLVDVAIGGGVGYGIGYCAAVSNPLAFAGLAATIALVSFATKNTFSSIRRELFIAGQGFRLPPTEVLFLNAKIVFDTLIGAALFATFATGALTIKFAAIPVITLIGFGCLVMHGGSLVTATLTLAQRTIAQCGH